MNGYLHIIYCSRCVIRTVCSTSSWPKPLCKKVLCY
jgi:hypothetical protein